MKDIKLSFPYPSTSRHNLSQDVALSLSMGLVVPVRVVEVLAGDSHRIGTSFSLVSNPLVKPLLQGVNMRYCRFWVPRRIYHLDERANNSEYDPRTRTRRYGEFGSFFIPVYSDVNNDDEVTYFSNFQASSLVDYLGLGGIETGINVGDPLVGTAITVPAVPLKYTPPTTTRYFNAEPYVGYIDIIRNYFSDSANGMACFMGFSGTTNVSSTPCVPVVVPLEALDSYIDSVQNSNSSSPITPLSFSSSNSFVLGNDFGVDASPSGTGNLFDSNYFGRHHYSLCVPLVRPDRLSRLFDTRPLTSQNAQVAASEITISNLSFLSKIQRFLTRRFFGGSRYTDVMYSVFGQKVPHVDSPVLLDVFDFEIGSELVPSTNAETNQNPGVLGGYFSSAGELKTSHGKFKRRYNFNEDGYLIDLVYIMPRLFRSSFVDDYNFLLYSNGSCRPSEGNFIPDFNGIGWQQPSFNQLFYNRPDFSSGGVLSFAPGYSCEPSWQQFRTLPDVCRGLMNPSRGNPGSYLGWANISGLASPVLANSFNVNSPIFTFSDNPTGQTVFRASTASKRLARNMFVDPNYLNSIFGSFDLVMDNIFAVFRYSHQAKRQVSKRFTLTFA